MTRFLRTVLSCLFIAGFGVGGATAAEWLVVQTSGDVVIAVAGARPASLTPGASLPAGGVLATGKASRAMLVRGEEQIIVGPNATIAIPEGATDSQFTTILQGAGVVEFTVEKRNVRHFAVETPHLAAVVKGTHFAVGVFATSSVVKVARGRVEVTEFATGQVVDVLPGQQAISKRGWEFSVEGEGALSPIRQGEPASPGEAGEGGALASVGIGVDVVGAGNGIGATVNTAVQGVGAAAAFGIGVGNANVNASVNAGLSGGLGLGQLLR